MFDLLRNTQNRPSPWFNVVPSWEELCQAVAAKQTWSQHWTRWQEVQVWQFLWLIASKIKQGTLIGDYTVMFIR